ncbi:MAG: TIGR01777 family oxidoreductase [Spirulinaceae cyanobacterium]
MKIAITGATGFVGKLLVEKLYQQGQEILVFTRKIERAQQVFPPSTFPKLEIVSYTPTQSGTWQNKLSGCSAIVNLAGEPIANARWTKEEKQRILDSRELGTREIVEGIKKAEIKPQVLINSSAIGYYGSSETKTFVESSPSGNDFLAQVCQAWEAEAQKVRGVGVRLVVIRTGIVLGDGGALAKMIPPFKMFAGGPLGSGRQWFSWIHREDLVNLIIAAIKQPEIEGIYNGTAPNPVRMNEFCQTLGEVMNRPSWLPVPDFALELLLGEGAQVVLEGQQVLPKRTQSSSFEYKYPDLKPALTDIVNG